MAVTDVEVVLAAFHARAAFGQMLRVALGRATVDVAVGDHLTPAHHNLNVKGVDVAIIGQVIADSFPDRLSDRLSFLGPWAAMALAPLTAALRLFTSRHVFATFAEVHL